MHHSYVDHRSIKPMIICWPQLLLQEKRTSHSPQSIAHIRISRNEGNSATMAVFFISQGLILLTIKMPQTPLDILPPHNILCHNWNSQRGCTTPGHDHCHIMLWVQQQGSQSSELPLSSEEAKRSVPIMLRHGTYHFARTIYLTNILISLIHYDGVLMLVYGAYTKLQHQPMALLCLFIIQPFKKSSKRNLNAVNTLALCRKQKWSPLLDPSSPRHYPWFPRPENQENFVWYITFHILSFHLLNSHQLITLSTPICTLACGALSPPYATLFVIYPLALKPQFRMLQRHIAPSQSHQINGPASWLNYKMKTPLPLTPTIILVSLQLEEFMVNLEMLLQIFFVLKELVPSQNGLMTIFSSEHSVSTSPLQ